MYTQSNEKTCSVACIVKRMESDTSMRLDAQQWSTAQHIDPSMVISRSQKKFSGSTFMLQWPQDSGEIVEFIL